MVAIDSKSNSTSNLVGIKENITVDEVDMLFAELFAWFILKIMKKKSTTMKIL